MAEITSIAWADSTFNPWRGCAKISPGCTNCYAEKQSKRNPRVLGQWGPHGRRAIAAESYWKQPFKWNREALAAGERRRVFCASLADVFEDRSELVGPRLRLFGVIKDTEHLDWLLLTKRPENIQRLWPRYVVYDSNAGLRQERWTSDLEIGISAHNIWLGVSVEDKQHGLPRIDVLRQIPAVVRFLSIEPLLEPLGKIDLTGIDWVIVGGESGHGARSFHLDWARDILHQCRAANVPCFVKQLGSDPCSNDDRDPENSKENTRYALGTLLLKDAKGGDWSEWPEDLRVRQLPAARAV